jgi:nucleoside-diphosphate-sugar epimerase
MGEQAGVLDGRRIALTGVTGQVGASLAAGLAPGNEVFGLARYTRPGSRDEVAALGVTPVVCDYTCGDFSGVPADVDFVIHVAADTNPATVDIGIEQNVIGTGRLFHHFASATAWFYTSTTGVYWDHADDEYAYKEGDRCGGSTRVTERFHYGTTKFAGEAVAQALSVIHDVPLVMARLNWSYGRAGYGGLPGAMADMVLAGIPIEVHRDWKLMGSPIHEDDLVASLGPLLGAATVGGLAVNWAGDDAISHVELVEYISSLIGVTPTFKEVTTSSVYPRVTDNTRRQSIYGPCRVKWKDGVRRIIAERYPELTLAPADEEGP